MIVNDARGSSVTDAGQDVEYRVVGGEARTLQARRLFGLFNRKERWALSGRGWLMIATLLIAGIGALLLSIQPFLAVSDRRPTTMLVVEGWIHDYAIRAAVDEFKAHGYEKVFSTGGPVSGGGGYTNDFNTSASVGAERLTHFGLARDAVQMVPSRELHRDRTYSAAIALRDWFQKHHVQPDSINVLTEGVHARRSRLLFQKAFGPDTKVGVIGIDNPDFPASRWWRYSEGVKEVISEAAAYLYARAFFFPKSENQVRR